MPKFIIEARDIQYQRIGLIENYTNFEGIIRHNAVGAWSLTVPGGTPEVAHLQPGNGIIVRIDGQSEVAFSGPITAISHQWDESNRGDGSVTVSGVTDDQLLFERVTYPIPANGLDNQTDDRNIRIAIAGHLMQLLVSENCGPDARPERIYPELDVADSSMIGDWASVSTRFDVLGEVLQEIANSQGLGFRVRQGNSDRLLFEVFVPRDKTDLVFGKRYGNLQAYSYDIAAPTATRLIFACQGEGKDRYFKDAVYNPFLVETWDDRDSRIRYTGEFDRISDNAAYRQTMTILNPGDEAALTFTGTGIRMYGTAIINLPSNNYVYLDGSPSPIGFEIPPTLGKRVLLYEIGGLAYGQHTIRFEADDGFWIDYIEILDERVLADWRRNSERFYDRRDIPVAWNPEHTSLINPGEKDENDKPLPADPAVYWPMLDQATLEAWEDNGPRASLSMTPIDTATTRYGRDYRVGDIVTVDINGAPFTEVLREVRLVDGDDGPRVVPTIGDSQASSTPTLYRTVRRLWSKVRKLEAR